MLDSMEDCDARFRQFQNDVHRLTNGPPSDSLRSRIVDPAVVQQRALRSVLESLDREIALSMSRL
jgi:hypothetical protein